MYGLQVLKVIGSLLLVALLVACQPVDFSKLKDDKGFLTGLENKFSKITRPHVTNNLSDRPKPLLDILKVSLASNNWGSNFTSSVKYALDTDPFIVTKRREAEALA